MDKFEEVRRRIEESKGKPGRPPKYTETHCAKGHEWTEEILFINSRNQVVCRACDRRRGRKPVGLPRQGSWRQRVVQLPPEGWLARHLASPEWVNFGNNKQHTSTHCSEGHAWTDETLRVISEKVIICRVCREEEIHNQLFYRGSTCPLGHEFTRENTYWPPVGSRQCRECMRERNNQEDRKAERAKRYAIHKKEVKVGLAEEAAAGFPEFLVSDYEAQLKKERDA